MVDVRASQREEGRGGVQTVYACESADPLPPHRYVSPTVAPERSGPRGIGIHHAGAELEPAKGDSARIKRQVQAAVT